MKLQGVGEEEVWEQVVGCLRKVFWLESIFHQWTPEQGSSRPDADGCYFIAGTMLEICLLHRERDSSAP